MYHVGVELGNMGAIGEGGGEFGSEENKIMFTVYLLVS